MVVGGGLAGIAAALQLADAGRAVTLLEGRPRLGGAAFSFRRGELSIDNGQHVFLRCCDGLPVVARTARRRSTRSCLQDRLDIPVLRADGRRAPAAPLAWRARAGPPDAPRWPATALLSRPTGSARSRGALALRRLDPADASLDAQTLGDFLRRHGQNDATISALWGIVATATLNLDPDEASLALAAKVFRTGLLDHAAGGRRGLCRRPARRAALDAAARGAGRGRRRGAARPPRRVDRAGAGSRAARRAGAQRCWRRGRGRAGRPATAKRSPRAPALATRRPPRRAAARRDSPIVNVHVIYDRQVTDLPFAAAVDSPVQWFFDRTDTSGLRRVQPGAQYLAVTVSAADAMIDEPSRTLQRAVRGRAGRGCCLRRDRRRGRGRVRHPRAAGDVPAGRRAARRCGPAPSRASTACGWPGRGPPPAGRTRWRARCAAGSAAAEAALRERLATGTSHRAGRRMTATAPHGAPEVLDADARARRRRRCGPRSTRLATSGCGSIAGYQLGWCDADGRPGTGGGGKAIRPALAVLSAEAVGGAAGDGVPGAVAVELVHNFSLLHDDIMDRDVERRHRPTGWVVFGEGQAILAGNAMLTAAIEVLVRAGGAGRARLPCCSRDPAADQRPVGGPRPRGQRRRDRRRGARHGGRQDGGAAGLRGLDRRARGRRAGRASSTGWPRFGHELGMAFQLVDDILGIVGDPAAPASRRRRTCGPASAARRSSPR